jgi:glutathione S-transferase
MKLYYTPGTCSISPHIALLEAGLPFDLVKVDLRTRKTADGEDFTRISPKGYVPALLLDDGELLTEGAIIVKYLADLKPETRLIPPYGTFARVRLEEWLHFIATELHKGMSPLYNPKASEELKVAVQERLVQRFGVLAKAVAGQHFLTGNTFTVADGYAYYVLRAWKTIGKADLNSFPALKGYFERIEARPSVKAALAAEGIS